MEKPTLEQVNELHAQITLGRVTRENLQGFLRDPSSTLRRASSVITLTDTVTAVCPAEFVASKRCQTGLTVKICYFYGGFDKWFFDKVERLPEPVETTLRWRDLLNNTSHEATIAELGGITKAETSLAEIWSLLEKQANGQDGVLLNSGKKNIFYVRDAQELARMIEVYWHAEGWCIGACDLEVHQQLKPDSRLFFREA